MKTQNKSKYSAPQLTVVSFKIEQGFAGSNYSQLQLWELENTNNDLTEDYTIRSGWDETDNHFFN